MYTVPDHGLLASQACFEISPLDRPIVTWLEWHVPRLLVDKS